MGSSEKRLEPRLTISKSFRSRHETHELVALSAPRPVFIGTRSPPGDAWVDPKGMFLAGVYAGGVCTRLGKKGLGTTEYPPVGATLIDGDIGFREHAEGHTPGPNWPAFLEFAARYFEQLRTPE